MKFEYNNVYTVTCAMLDATKHYVDFSCAMMRLGLLSHGHRDGFDDWIEKPTGSHLTGKDDLPAIDVRAQALLGRFVSGVPEVGTMPSFEAPRPDESLTDLAP